MYSQFNPEILAAVEQLGMTDKAIEEAAGLPQAFLSKLRRGRSSGRRATISLDKLKAFVRSKGVPLADDGPPVNPDSVEVASEDECEGVRSEIAEAIRAAKSPDDVVKVNAMLGAAVARGEFDRFTAATLDQILGELRQALKTAREHEDRFHPREPVKVVVEHINDWRKNPVNCPSCGKTWFEALDDKRARDQGKGKAAP